VSRRTTARDEVSRPETAREPQPRRGAAHGESAPDRSRGAESPGSLPPERFARILKRERALDAGDAERLALYLAELDAWRRRINLTGQLSAQELGEHALEAMPAADLISEGEGVVDIGSGSGFPAIPLAILKPEAVFTLLEPTAKKAAFLRHVARTLALSNVAVRAARIEDVGGQTFDVATTRGVGSLGPLLGSAAFLRPGGRLLVWTTDAEALARGLPAFRLSHALPIPGSRAKVIAVLTKPGG
jgi:16S rRNA (guanine527-N7)-methyltransferase